MSGAPRGSGGADPSRATALALLTPEAVRARCGRLLDLAERGALEHLALDPARLDAVAERVVAVTRRDYPDLVVPYHSRWRHLEVDGLDLEAALREGGASTDLARTRARFDLVITSVLLDAGAGTAWRYAPPRAPRPGDTPDARLRRATPRAAFARSEGLALASRDLFLAGGLSSDPARPLQADAAGLRALRVEDLARAFQVRPDNPLLGLEGRAALLNRLGEVLLRDPGRFGDPPRPAGLFDLLAGEARDGAVPAAALLRALLVHLGPIWPGRCSLGGVDLGDTWPHPALAGPEPGADLVPFHKLSQWLAYSLLEPLEGQGLSVAGLDALTGLAEYRNGGLLLDLGLLRLRDPRAADEVHAPGSPLVVEWRALTVALLDRVAERVRERLGLDAWAFPLAKVLQGGTWTAGREVARERRAAGGPPLLVQSDGTLF